MVNRSFMYIFSVFTAFIGATGFGFQVFADGNTYNLMVQSDKSLGAWNRFYEECVGTCHPITVLSSVYGRNIQNAMRKGSQECGFKRFRCHNIFGNDIGIYSENNGTPAYNWAKMDEIYDSARSHGMTPIIELSGMPSAMCSGTPGGMFWYNGSPINLNVPKDWNKWRDLIKAMVVHLEQKYGADEVRKWYFEVWNEPDLFKVGSGNTQDNYMKLYDYASEGVRLADSLCKVGGPTVSGSGSGPDFITSWLNHVVSGTNYATGQKGSKADFLTYHRYGNDVGYSSGTSAPLSMNSYHKAIVNLAKTAGFSKPLVCSEWGSTYNQEAIHCDHESSASFNVKTIHMLIENGADYPPPLFYSFWTLSDIFEEQNHFSGNNKPTAYENSYGLLTKGDPNIPDSWDLEKPSFNAYKLLHKMTDTRISLTGGTMNNGINGVATISKDKISIQILLYNHIDGGTANSSAGDTVYLNVSAIPFNTSSAKEDFILIDQSHSNSYRVWQSMGSPVAPNATQFKQLNTSSQLSYIDSAKLVTLTNKSYSTKFILKQNAVAFISLANPSPNAIASPRHQESRSEQVVSRTTGLLTITNSSVLPNHVRIYSVDGRQYCFVMIGAKETLRITSKNLPSLCIIKFRTGNAITSEKVILPR